MPSHFVHQLTGLLVSSNQQFTCSGRDPDGVKYRRGNNNTANKNVRNYSLYTC